MCTRTDPVELTMEGEALEGMGVRERGKGEVSEMSRRLKGNLGRQTHCTAQ